jgi:hypothetical protein
MDVEAVGTYAYLNIQPQYYLKGLAEIRPSRIRSR